MPHTTVNIKCAMANVLLRLLLLSVLGSHDCISKASEIEGLTFRCTCEAKPLLCEMQYMFLLLLVFFLRINL